MTPSVDVVSPCLDKVAALPWVLSRIPVGYRAVVADNGSTDGSPDVAGRFGVYVVPLPRRGFGPAAHVGLKAGRSAEVDVDHAPRTAGGRSTVTGTVLCTVRMVAYMSWVRVR